MKFVYCIATKKETTQGNTSKNINSENSSDEGEELYHGNQNIRGTGNTRGTPGFLMIFDDF